MTKLSLLVLTGLCLCGTVWAQCVVGVEANGPDQATMSAYTWRKTNVYENVYAAKGFKVVLISQSSKAKLEDALRNNPVTHITGCGHGSPTVYTGYSQATVFSTGDTTLLQKLAGKHVHLLSCLTAQQLGPKMIQLGAASFAGYHPSFYFTWKSTARFFDADAELDRAFAENIAAPQAYQRTINKFNEIMKILETEEPSAVQYIVIDRDGLRCMPSSSREEADFSLPIELAARTLYGKNMESKDGSFMTFADCCATPTRATIFSTLSEKEFADMAVAKFEKLDRDFELCVLSLGKFHRDQIIEEIKRNSDLGKKILDSEKEFLKIVSESRWSKTIQVTTDANGAINTAATFDVPMTITTKTVKATWSGQPDSFSSATFALNGETLFTGSVTNGKSYTFQKKINSGACQYSLTAAGGPKNATITVTIYFDLGR